MRFISTQWRPVLWVTLPIYFASNLYLIFLGETTGVILILATTVYTALLSWQTTRVTTQQPVENDSKETPQHPAWIWAQIAVVMVFVIITGISVNIPIWSNMVGWFFNLGEIFLPAEWFGGPGNSVANPVQYFVFPFILLLLMGAHPTDLGFGKGHKVWQASLVWLALPFVIWVGLLATGNITLQFLARRLISNFFQNGFFEEFLMRGALQTRLKKVLPLPWALTVQALIFGLWHLRANASSVDGNILAAIAICIISQTVAGFIYGWVFERTRNLVVPTVAHVVMNAIGQTFSG